MLEFAKKYYLLAIGVTILTLAILMSRSSNSDKLIFEPLTKTVVLEDIIYIYVDIKGEVMNQGVYKVEEGTRLFQVISLAGGLTMDADVLAFNLSLNLSDEQVVYIPSVNDEYPLITENSENQENGLVNINTATSILLETLPGIGPSTAKSIIDYREENGSFSSIEDLILVPGIGEITLDEIKDFIKI